MPKKVIAEVIEKKDYIYNNFAQGNCPKNHSNFFKYVMNEKSRAEPHLLPYTSVD